MAGSHFPPVKRARHKKNLHARGYVRSLAIVTRKLFNGGPLYGTLATVASVPWRKTLRKIKSSTGRRAYPRGGNKGGYFFLIGIPGEF